LPVPVRLEVCGLPTALSLTCNVPVLVPVAVGVNTTLMVQLDLAARLVVQVVADALKSPVVEIEMPVSATLCLLASVNTFAGLLVPQAVTVYTSSITKFRNGFTALGTVTGNVRVVGLLVKDPVSGNTVLIARYVDVLN